MNRIHHQPQAKPLISIIVPAYNVEAYIDKCLASLHSQTLQDIEVIVINDGSTDNTGAVCEAWKAKDNRLHIIHQENKGISETRNIGLAASKGHFIGFVDGDDWVEPQMFERLYNAVQNYSADIAMCGAILDEADKTIKIHDHAQKEQRLDACTALIKLLWDKYVRSYCWNKIFRASLFKDIFFPPGRIFEDYSTVYKLFAKANAVVHTGTNDYHYIQRPGSILSSLNPKKEVDFFLANYERYGFIASYKGFTRIQRKLLLIKTIKRMLRTNLKLKNLSGENEFLQEKAFMDAQLRDLFRKDYKAENYKNYKLLLNIKQYLARFGL
ncbi:glycosyltransferase family 2 protein [Haoranjiania flava]|uniref:Glycosyltransferase n=1 Tax=Haoranjiania flava TaxID=1856322 RepID=A0AAE3INF9_9BACT|nr:glycosyltransferase [Haoranjiania flava]MCU7695109.1 glycosyltransferase [Haoranjiania flava]